LGRQIARIVGRRIVPGADAAVLNHFRTSIVEQAWETQQ
jgi:hypothetical protein